MNKIIGIAGKAGTGKSEVANLFCDYCVIAFADILKRILKEIFDFTDDQLWGPSQNRNAPDYRYPIDLDNNEYLTPRLALQMLGSFGRNCYPDIWTEYTMRIVDKLLIDDTLRYTGKKGLYSKSYPSYSGVIISDCRYINEANAIRRRGGKIILVKRQTSLTGSLAQHESEHGLPEDDVFYDYVIDNYGTLDDLKKQVLIFNSTAATRSERLTPSRGPRRRGRVW